MRILLLSKWSSPIVYDLYFFLKSLSNIEVIPCSYGFKFNERVRIDELRDIKDFQFHEKISARKINYLCDTLDINIICISWLLEIQELLAELPQINRPVILFPHGYHHILKKTVANKNIYLVINDDHFRDSNNCLNMHYFVSRRFVNKEKKIVMDGSLFFPGWSNLSSEVNYKIALRKFIETYAQNYKIYLLRMFLYTLYPVRLLKLRRYLNRFCRIINHQLPDFSVNFKEQIEQRKKQFIKYFANILTNNNVRLLDFIPYNDLSCEIAKANFVEVTPAVYSPHHVPARATIALVSGTALLLKRYYCPHLEKIIMDYKNGFIYNNYEEIFRIVRNEKVVSEICYNALKYRYKFTLEEYSGRFLEFLNKINLKG